MAESRYIAEDALQLIVVNYEPLPAVVDLEGALLAENTPVHEDLESNLASHVIQEIGDYEFNSPASRCHCQPSFHV